MSYQSIGEEYTPTLPKRISWKDTYNRLNDPSNRFLRLMMVVLSVLLIATLIFAFAFVIMYAKEVSDHGDDDDEPYSSLKNYCKDVAPISGAEFKERQDNLVTGMKGSNVDATLIESGANLQYYTGIRWGRSERPFLWLATANNTYFVIPSFEEKKALELIEASGLTGVAEVILWEENEMYYDKLNTIFTSLFGAGADFNLAYGNEMRFFIADTLQTNNANLKVVTSDVTSNLREKKSSAEIEILNCANRATKAAIREVGKNIEEGMTQKEVAVQLSEAQSIAGLSDIWHLVLFGKNAAFPHGTEEDNGLKKDEMILIDTGGSLYGYQSDVSRTFTISDVDKELEDAWKLVKNAQTLAMEAIKPGVTCAEIEKIARDVIVDGGYGPNYMYFTHRLGHGIGLQVHEDPYLVEGNNKVLEEGMTFSVEPGIYNQGKWGIRIEDIVRVTADSHEVLGPVTSSLEDPFKDH